MLLVWAINRTNGALRCPLWTAALVNLATHSLAAALLAAVIRSSFT